MSGIRVFRLTTLDFTLNVMLALLWSKYVFHLSSVSWNVLGELMKMEAVLN